MGIGKERKRIRLNINLIIKIMGWGIDFKADVFLSRQSYASKNEVEDRIRELESEINDCEATLKMYAASTPKDVYVLDGNESAIGWLNIEVNTQFGLYKDYLYNKYQLELYLEYLNDGGGIKTSE